MRRSKLYLYNEKIPIHDTMRDHHETTSEITSIRFTMRLLPNFNLKQSLAIHINLFVPSATLLYPPPPKKNITPCSFLMFSERRETVLWEQIGQNHQKHAHLRLLEIIWCKIVPNSISKKRYQLYQVFRNKMTVK